MKILMSILMVLALSSQASAETYGFGVLSQRSALLTAQYWNPILAYISQKAGVDLQVKVARTAPESNKSTEKGDYDFVYSNTIFLPIMAQANYQVILKPRGKSISGQIVTLEQSLIKTLNDLNNQTVGFPSKAAFVGYAVPMDQLLRQNVQVKPVFGGNQEGIMGQLKSGKVIAAGVNSLVMKAFADREQVRYRILWESEAYHNLPISAHPRVPEKVANAVQQAFIEMPNDPEGMKILEAGTQIVPQKPPLGFEIASPADYRNYVEFYKNTVVTDIE